MKRKNPPALSVCTIDPPAVDHLEPRLLLSAARLAHGPLTKIGTDLSALYQSTMHPTEAPHVHAGLRTVQIEAYAIGPASKLATEIRRVGGTRVRTIGRAVTAIIPDKKLPALAALPRLRFAQPASFNVDTSPAPAQLDHAAIADVARTTYGLTGASEKIGIISDSFNTSTSSDKYANDIASGALPAGIQILSDYNGGTDEGRAMAQLVYASAPGATLIFDTGEGGQSVMASAINTLRLAGAKIIVDDFSYFAEPMFQDGVIAQAVETAIANGVTFVSSVGNNAQQAYANNWSSGDTFSNGAIPGMAGAPQFYGGTAFNFAASGQPISDTNSFTLAAGASINLSFQWDSPYFSASGGSGSPNSVDAYVLNAAGTQIVGGSANYDVGGDPVQLINFTNTTGASATFKLLLVNEAGPTPGYLKYVDFAGQATNWQYGFNSGSAFGHANAAGVESVGAAYWNNTSPYGTSPAIPEPTTSWGVTPILFSNSGTRLGTPTIRQTPSITAPDGGNTTFFGTTIPGGNGYPYFYGTSASAAVVAAIDALILQKNPSLTPAQVNSALNNTAADMATAGYDNQTGYGLVQANAAVASVVGNVSGVIFHDNNSNGSQDTGENGVAGVTVYVDANHNGTLDSAEISTTTASDGSYTLSTVPSGSQSIRIVAPTGYVAITAAQTGSVVGGGSISAVNFGVFPDSFSITGGSANYLLQVDASKSTNDDILVGGSIAYIVAKSILPALGFTFAGNNNQMTVSFLNGNPVPSGGMTVTAAVGGSSNVLTLNGGTGIDTVSINFQTTTFNGSSIFASNFTGQVINGNNGNDSFTVLNTTPASQALTFNGGTGNTSLTVKFALPNNGANTVFNAGTASGDQNTLTVNAGEFQFNGNPAAASANLTVNDNSNVVFKAGTSGSGFNARQLAALNLGTNAVATVNAPPTHGDRAVLVLGGLSLASGSKLDLSGNDMIVHHGTPATLNTSLKNGFASGAWNGTGLYSTTAHNDAAHKTALGMMLNIANGTVVQSTFDGQSAVTTDVLIKYTYYGDANLDGTINGNDYTQIDSGYGSNNILTGWQNGDFNYDGLVDGSDYSLIDNLFNVQGPAL